MRGMVSALMMSAFTVAKAANSSIIFSTPGTFSWTVPPGVSSISIVGIGGGGGGSNEGSIGGNNPLDIYNTGGGGALGCVNSYAVSSNQVLVIKVGAGGIDANLSAATTAGGATQVYLEATPSTFIINAGGGGNAATKTGGVLTTGSGSNGGVGVYTTNSGAGGNTGVYTGVPGTAFSIGQTLSGTSASTVPVLITKYGTGSSYSPTAALNGAVRIVWDGAMRTFPATLVNTI